MYHTIGSWTAVPSEEVVTLFREKVQTYAAPNGKLVSITEKDDGTFEVIRQWSTLEDANSWAEFSATSDISGPVTVVQVPE
jgi:hypothetical protein